MATQAIDRETIMDGAITAKRDDWSKDEITTFNEDDLTSLIDKMPLVKPMAYTVYHNLTLVNNKLKDSDGDPKLIKAYDAILSLISKLEPEDRVDFNF